MFSVREIRLFFLKIFSNSSECVPCSRIRISAITELASLGSENLSTIANCFAQHSEKVCKKYHVRHLLEREAARLSWKCCEKYKPRDGVCTVAKTRTAAMKKCGVSKTNLVKKWIKEITAKIKLLTNNDVEDQNLMKELNKLSLQEGV